MGKVKGNTRRKRELFKANPHCHWCGRLTTRSASPLDERLIATVDHLVSRIRGRTTRDLANTVLACNQCNQARNDAEQKGRAIVGVTVNEGGNPNYVYQDDPSGAVLTKMYSRKMERLRNAVCGDYHGVSDVMAPIDGFRY